MFKIGEFSKISQVSIRMLRYYDEQGLLQPSKVDEESGYRLYCAEQLDRLNRIVLLRDMGFGVKEMRELLENWDVSDIRKNLQEQRERTRKNIAEETNRLHQIESMLHDLEQEASPLGIEIVMKRLPGESILSLRRVVADYYREGELWQEFSQALKGIKNPEGLSCFTIYHDVDYREEQVDIEVCVTWPVTCKAPSEDKLVFRQVEAVEQAACFMIYGPYSNISRAYREFATWLERHEEYEMVGQNRQICHVGMDKTHNPMEFVTELQIPLRYRKR